MSYYDVYLTKKHPDLLTKIFLRYNKNILSYLMSFYPNKKPVSILEIGPGKGYFRKAVIEFNEQIQYSALDRNKAMLKNLKIPSAYLSVLPKLPKFKNKFDIIYASYVIEHLNSGYDLFQLIGNCKKYLNPNGHIVFLAPNCLTQKMEFWNGDYTHSYPTTKRNVAMTFYDNDIKNLKILDYTDIALWLTPNHRQWKFLTTLIKILLFFYNYRFFQFIFTPIYKNPEYSLDNLFYKFYYFTKADQLMILARSQHEK